MRKITLLRTLLAVLFISVWGGVSAQTFVKINSVADLTTGRYVIANDLCTYVASIKDAKTYLTAVAGVVTTGATSVDVSDLDQIWDITVGDNGNITIKNGTKYVASNGGSNQVSLPEVVSDIVYFVPSIDKDGNINLACLVDTDAARSLQFNANAGQERFACYKNTMKNLTLFKEGTVDPSAIAAPTFSVKGGDYYAPISVELACITEGATIHYTLDGTTPTAASTEYTVPFTVAETTTVKAIAVVDDKVSDVSSIVYNFPAVETVADIAAYLAKADNQNPVTITGTVTVVYTDNAVNHYIQDASGSLLVYGGLNGQALKAGQTLTGLTGKYSPYQNLPEMALTSLGTIGQGSVIAPVEVAIGDITKADLNRYVVLKGVTATSDKEFTDTGKDDVDGKKVDQTFVVTFGGASMTMINKLKIVGSVTNGQNYDIEGFVSIYKDNMQFIPTSIKKSAGTGVDKVNVKANIYSVNGQIVIESDKMGETIEVYSLLGQRIASQIVTSNTTVIKVDRGVAIVKVGNSARKVVVK